mmetsp:Transcript_25323/g.35512  ORF Transcript_25323/g.35512 Transcript_25323/m.35512 type:complete len:128 (+) Transcript_25323:347-730(+)
MFRPLNFFDGVASQEAFLDSPVEVGPSPAFLADEIRLRSPRLRRLALRGGGGIKEQVISFASPEAFEGAETSEPLEEVVDSSIVVLDSDDDNDGDSSVIGSSRGGLEGIPEASIFRACMSSVRSLDL